MNSIAELAEQYSQTRLGILHLIVANRAKERLIDEETRAKLRLGGFPKWFAMYYDANPKEDSLLFLQKILITWEKIDFKPNDLQRKWLKEVEDAARMMVRLRGERTVLHSMRNETSFVIMELSRHTGVAPQIQVERDAGRLVKSRIKPVDYLDSIKDVAAVDVIEQLYAEYPEKRKEAQEISLDYLSVMERVCFRAHIEIPMSYGQIADELSAIAKAVAAEYGIIEDVNTGKDSVATHVQNAHKKLLQHEYQRRMIEGEEEVPDSPFDEYERELRRRFEMGLYQKQLKTVESPDVVQEVLW